MSRKILIVEDEEKIARFVELELVHEGYEVIKAFDGRTGLDLALSEHADLIVLDVNLPDGNGFDFCREVKERRPDTAVIFLTANDMESDMLKGYELGAETGSHAINAQRTLRT